LVVVVIALVAAPAASAGVVSFSSDRCPEAYPEGCTASLWTVRDDGTGLTRVTPPAQLAPEDDRSFDDSPSWSADGRSLLYRRNGLTGGSGLWIVSLESGSKAAQVGPGAPNALFDVYDAPDWSPDGTTIAFSGRPADAPRDPTGTANWSAIWSMTAAGTDIRRLTDGSRQDHSPVFSPDGSRIAFVRERADGGAAVLTMDRDGSRVAPVFVGIPPGARGLPAQGSFRLAWSPDGSEFAIGYQERLYTLRSGSSELEFRGVTGPAAASGSPFSQLVWSDEPLPALIFSLPMEGRPLQRLDLTASPLRAIDLTGPVTGSGGRPFVAGDQDPDWRPSSPVPIVPDVKPPAVVLTARRGLPSFLALDSAGVRRVDVAITRWARPHGAASWRRVRGVPALRRLVRRHPAGRYTLRLRATDSLGNRTKRSRTVRLRLAATLSGAAAAR
jgi:hypothetical protein